MLRCVSRGMGKRKAFICKKRKKRLLELMRKRLIYQFASKKQTTKRWSVFIGADEQIRTAYLFITKYT